MIQYLDLNNLVKIEANCVAIGFFESIHAAHRLILRTCVDLAQRDNLVAGLISFEPIDNFKSTKQGFIHKNQERYQELEKIIDKVYIFKLDSAFMNLSYLEFNQLLGRIGIKKIVCGKNFHYGRNREGNVDNLNFDVYALNQLYYRDISVSTTMIKKLLASGDIVTSNNLLTRDYKIKAEVVEGKKIGRMLGFPTANLGENLYFIPGLGVYFGYVLIKNQKYYALISIGYNESIAKLDKLSVEVHILDFNQDIYHQEIELYFLEKIRDHIKFPNVDLLIKQLTQDKHKAYQLLRGKYAKISIK